jgi:hypothetical protein
MLGFLGSDMLIEGDHNCYEKGELTSISIDIGGKERILFLYLCSPLFCMISSSAVMFGEELKVTLSKVDNCRDPLFKITCNIPR